MTEFLDAIPTSVWIMLVVFAAWLYVMRNLHRLTHEKPRPYIEIRKACENVSVIATGKVFYEFYALLPKNQPGGRNWGK